MGNGASIDPEQEGDALDVPANISVRVKSSQNAQDGMMTPLHEAKEMDVSSLPNVSEASVERDNNNAVRIMNATSSDSLGYAVPDSVQSPITIDSSSSNVHHNAHKHITVQPTITDDSIAEDGEDIQPMDLLLQFIPYYGQGDPSNDSLVRASLLSLSIEDIDTRDEYGNTLLLLASQYRCEDLVRIMLNKGADPNAINSSGACCLHFSCYRESASLPITKLLLQNGANPEVQEGTYGCTPLHYSAGIGDVEYSKLLLQYNAQITTQDYYNYTCVDYAREAGLTAVEEFCQKRLDKAIAQANTRNNYAMGSPLAVATTPYGSYSPDKSSFGNSFRVANSASDWQQYVDPESGGKYYVHTGTNECIWESEWKLRVSQQTPQQPPPPQVVTPQPPQQAQITPSNNTINSGLIPNSTKSTATKTVTISDPKTGSKPSAVNMELLIAQAARARLIGFLSKHDPTRLVEIETLLSTYKGKEQDLLRDLCKRYNVDESPEFAAFQAILKDCSAGPDIAVNGLASAKSSKVIISNINTDVLDPSRSNAAPMTSRGSTTPGTNNNAGAMISSAVAIAAAVEDAVKDCRLKSDAQLEEERAQFRSTISNKDGLISQLQSDVETLRRDKRSLEETNKNIQGQLNRSQLQGGEALAQVEQQLVVTRNEFSALQSALSTTQQELRYESEKVASLETTLSKTTLGHEEAIAKEQQAAETRARQQKDREMQHASEIKQLNDSMKQADTQARTEIAKVKSEAKKQEREANQQYDMLRSTKEQEIETMNRDFTQRAAQFAQELSAARMEAEDARKVADEACKRTEAAEAVQRSMQNEVIEARAIQQYNAQLHKDLGREQLARKRLHNEMEDLKGKIRVYVRVRPFSSSELERGCSEAVVKDGKLSVVVKGIGAPDAKKVYDFDQVFGGSDGNSQTDVFRDTKHLIMSVIDGYNVCIFAYGQTGAGKSYTMIGSADIGSCLQENGDFDSSAGITPRAVSELFRLLNERNAQVTFEVEVQMFQLYRDGLEDLLTSRKKKKGEEDAPAKEQLKIVLAEHSPTGLVQVDGAESLKADSPADVMRIFAKGSSRRTTASTQMNAESSRSHLICSLIVKLTNRRTGTDSIGKLTLVDLAGSERVDKSGAAGDVLKEAQSINKSLSALGDVIAALTSGQQHVPYRNHPLTMLMSDSIGGNAKTLMFVNTSPADYNNAESNSSLSFASRCKDITNAVASSPAVQLAQMNSLKKELAKLKKAGPGGGVAKNGLARPV